MDMKKTTWHCVPILLGVMVWPLLAATSAQVPTRSGQAEVAPFDAEVAALLKKYGVPGAAIAVARNGKLVVSRGYGIADRDSGRPVLPDTPFRIASLTKPLAAIVALVLADKGRLSLDQPVAAMLRTRLPEDTPPAKGRLAKITVRHLIQHTAAWGPGENPRGGGSDPEEIQKLRSLGQGDSRDNFVRIRAAWAIPPTEEPGAKFAYSTFGYCVLGSALEAAEGRPIDKLLNEFVFVPTGVKQFGIAAPHNGQPRPLAGETRYYDPPNSPTWNVTVHGRSVPVPRPDAYWPPRIPGACLSGGRAVMSAPDYLRVLTSAGGRRGAPLLSAARQALLFATSSTLSREDGNHGTHGLNHTPGLDGDTWWHTGGAAGTAAYYSRSGHFEWVALFNLQPEDRQIYKDSNAGMWRAVRAVRSWPAIDLF